MVGSQPRACCQVSGSAHLHRCSQFTVPSKDRAGGEHSRGAQARAGGSDTGSAGITPGLQSHLRRPTQAQTATELVAQENSEPGLGVRYLYWTLEAHFVEVEHNS